MVRYHDDEWGVPSDDDRHLFEHVILEIFQAGLSWLTVLKKRMDFRKEFADFAPESVARFNQDDIARLMENPQIIRNRAKIEAAVHNARAFLRISEEFNGFHSFLSKFRPDNPKIYRQEGEIPVSTPESEALAKELKRRGFKFIGPISAYAYMQGVGLVNDHIESCFRFAEIEKMNY